MKNFNEIINDYFDKELIDIDYIKYNKQEKSLEILIILKIYNLDEKFNQLKKQIINDLFFLDKVVIRKQYRINIEKESEFILKNFNEIIKDREEITTRFFSVLINAEKEFSENYI